MKVPRASSSNGLRKVGRKVERYDAWYMPRKYWSKIKEKFNQTSTLQKLKTDPRYLYKNLYEGTCEFPLDDQASPKDQAFMQQLETFERNK
jgi:hypothetical protein